MTSYEVTIDGKEADLAKFSEAIYKKILGDAKNQRFQGFRPGTIPPHLLNAYKNFAADETARETVFEALQQNEIIPFERSREDMAFSDVSFVPTSKGKKKKKGGRKKGASAAAAADTPPPHGPTPVIYASLEDAVKAGWAPGVSFSFIATVSGQAKGLDVMSSATRDSDVLQKMYGQ